MDSFGYVLGVILGDGSVPITKDYTRHKLKSGVIKAYPKFQYVIQLQCKSQEFAKRFATHLERLVGRKVIFYPFTRTTPKTTLVGARKDYIFSGFLVRIKDKHWNTILRGYKHPPAYNRFLVLPRDTMLAFLQGFIDSEGYYCKGQYWDISNKSILLLLTLQTMLEEFGIRSKVYQSPSQVIGHLRVHRNTDIQLLNHLMTRS